MGSAVHVWEMVKVGVIVGLSVNVRVAVKVGVSVAARQWAPDRHSAAMNSQFFTAVTFPVLSGREPARTAHHRAMRLP